jgi:hypothetical protein
MSGVCIWLKRRVRILGRSKASCWAIAVHGNVGCSDGGRSSNVRMMPSNGDCDVEVSLETSRGQTRHYSHSRTA